MDINYDLNKKQFKITFNNSFSLKFNTLMNNFQYYNTIVW